MGRAMLNICIVFAQLERETIQKRVTDAYYSRSQRGFKMGGKAPYGFHTEPIKMDGINTKKLVVNPDEAANIRLMFEMYAQPTTAYGDITRYFAEQGILFNGKELIRPTLAQMLRNPVYVHPICVISSLFGQSYPADELEYSWKTLMQNHPHDSICCCSVT